MSATGLVDVVIPVFNQFTITRDCIESVIASRDQNNFEIVVVDDGSSDKSLVDYLRQTEQAGSITLIRISQNIGFTGSVNTGMRLHDDRDVVLLNSDTLVFGSWVERLRAGAYSDPWIATSNPLTNSSHMSSYPNRDNKNNVALEVDAEALDNLAKKYNAGKLAFVHTTVGFCMFIKRDALRSIGYFSQTYFPIGYGEESDFCYRARKTCWKHVIVGDVFVKHLENQSFGEQKHKLFERMIATFKTLHPEYERLDREFKHRDPLKRIRQRLDLARLRQFIEPDHFIRIGTYKTGLHADPVALDVDFETGRSTFSVTGQQTFENLVSYKLPNDIARFNSDLKFLGISELVCSSSEDLATFTQLVSGKSYEIGLEPRVSVAGDPLMSASEDVLNAQIARAEQVRNELGLGFPLNPRPRPENSIGCTVIACDDANLSGPLIGIRLSERLYFGNSVIQLSNALGIAKKLGLRYVQIAREGNELLDLRNRFSVDGVEFLPADMPLPPGGCFLYGLFFHRDGFNPLPHLEPMSAHQDLLRRAIKPLYPKVFSDPIPEVPTDELVIHIRSGDIFLNSGHPSYVQPPLAFYEMIIDKLKAEGRINSVRLVYQDKLNPVIEVLEQRIKDRTLPLSCQCGSAEEDIRVLLGAKHLAFGFGSFCYAILMLSDQKDTVHFFCPKECSAFGTMPNVSEFFDVTDGGDSYIKLGDWMNTPDQRKLMLEYPVSELTYVPLHV